MTPGKLKPLKMSWRTWCIDRLARRDYSAHEMREKIRKRAAASGQEVDAEAVVEGLVQEGIVDDRRYLENQIAMYSGTFSIKGPRELARKFLKTGGVSRSLVAEYVDPEEQRWFDLALNYTRGCFEREFSGSGEPQEVPEKLFFRIKNRLYRKGFTRHQIEFALSGFKPVRERRDNASPEEVRRWIDKRMAEGRGPDDIRYFLKQKGFTDSVIQTHLEIPEEVWIEAAAQTREKRFGTRKPGSAKEKRKQTDFLRRRGFRFDHITRALDGT